MMTCQGLKLLALLAFCAVCGAQRIRYGQCPDVQLKRNFQLRSYMGVWYEYERYSADELRGKCNKANYRLKRNGRVRVEYTAQLKRFGTYGRIVGEAYAPDAAVPAKLFFKFPYPSGTGKAYYWVLDTDYSNYSVVYWCVKVRMGTSNVSAYLDYMWIMSRTRGQMSESALSAAYRALESVGKGENKWWRKQDQTNCRN